jgi:TPR repeat protein
MSSADDLDIRADADPVSRVDPIASLRIAADHGDPDAQLRYGRCLWFGEGIVMDKSLSAHYFKL